MNIFGGLPQITAPIVASPYPYPTQMAWMKKQARPGQYWPLKLQVRLKEKNSRGKCLNNVLKSRIFRLLICEILVYCRIRIHTKIRKYTEHLATRHGSSNSPGTPHQ